MKERPIIFNPEMISAILDGSKTQTRRPVRQKYSNTKIELVAGSLQEVEIVAPPVINPDGSKTMHLAWAKWINRQFEIGDRLWVKEKWGYFKDGQIIPTANVSPDGRNIAYWKKHKDYIAPTPEGKWKPSIHMPRWASRILLEITDIKVERVQEISIEDCLSEGMLNYNRWKSKEYIKAVEYAKLNKIRPPLGLSPYERFKHIWHSVYKNWSANPWVWVVEFKVIEVK